MSLADAARRSGFATTPPEKDDGSLMKLFTVRLAATC